jgi:hypothetical protein
MKCCECEAPAGKFITRKRGSGSKDWTTSLNLYHQQPQEYETPRKVILDVQSRCQFCAPRGGVR